MPMDDFTETEHTAEVSVYDENGNWEISMEVPKGMKMKVGDWVYSSQGWVDAKIIKVQHRLDGNKTIYIAKECRE
jgi:hypothetical protein